MYGTPGVKWHYSKNKGPFKVPHVEHQLIKALQSVVTMNALAFSFKKVAAE